MLRLAERYTGKARPGDFGVGSQSRLSEAVVRPGARLSTGSGYQAAAPSGRTPFDSPGAAGRPAERHDWLVPLELP